MNSISEHFWSTYTDYFSSENKWLMTAGKSRIEQFFLGLKELQKTVKQKYCENFYESRK